MKILIGGALPYANGSLHIGHLAALLPADIIARYYRLKGDDVYFISGSDCFGTPVSIRAKTEGKSPAEISNYYHNEFKHCFDAFGFSFDLYGKTSDSSHISFVQDFHRKLYDSRHIYEKALPQAYCCCCKQFLPDRFVNGTCPSCGSGARGDQCDSCGKVLEPEVLLNPECTICGDLPEFKETKHLFIAISAFEKELADFVSSRPHLRKNAAASTNRYIKEGLRDRAITRDLDWGIDVPKDGYEDKKIYIWAENVLAYLSQSKEVCRKRGSDFGELWGDNAKHYYVHGKDNIPFHTVILPSLLLAHHEKLHLPDEIVSSEYLTLEGKKISTSNNHAIWLKDIINEYDPDSIRYYLTACGPERKDSNFSLKEYFNVHNSELLGGYGNFINRSVVFIEKYLGGIVPEGKINPETSRRISETYIIAGKKIEKANLRDALDEIFSLVRFANKYFDTEKPWQTISDSSEICSDTLYNCIVLAVNLASLLYPFLPFSSKKVLDWFGPLPAWSPRAVSPGYKLHSIKILFTRLIK